MTIQGPYQGLVIAGLFAPFRRIAAFHASRPQSCTLSCGFRETGRSKRPVHSVALRSSVQKGANNVVQSAIHKPTGAYITWAGTALARCRLPLTREISHKELIGLLGAERTFAVPMWMGRVIQRNGDPGRYKFATNLRAMKRVFSIRVFCSSRAANSTRILEEGPAHGRHER